MADVTGPIRTVPGHLHVVPNGMTCDEHNDRKAVYRVQGETDSFGSEMVDMCQECFDQHMKWKKEERESEKLCDWCGKMSKGVISHRDWEEGHTGPVYRVCPSCRVSEIARIMEEKEYDRRKYGDYDDYDD